MWFLFNGLIVTISSHNRFNSYSTVSTNAPETPPSNHYASFPITDVSSPRLISPEYDLSKRSSHEEQSSQDDSRLLEKQSIPGRQSQNSDHKSKTACSRLQSNNDRSQEATMAPRIESMIIKRAISSDTLEGNSPQNQDNAPVALDEQKTPSAELSNPLAASGFGYTMRFEDATGPSFDRTVETPTLHSALDTARSYEKPNLADLSSREAAQHIMNNKGKAKAIDQDIQADVVVDNSTAFAGALSNTTLPGLGREEVQTVPQGSVAPLASSIAPRSTSDKKISEWLREQYEYKQRYGNNVAPTISSTSKTPNALDNSAERSNHTAASSAHSPQGRPLDSLPSRDSPRSKLSADPQTERAELLHTIISQDFGGLNGSTMRPIVRSHSKDLLWHPTEYVGPPRRRSISGTSMLGLGRKGQDSRPGFGKHQRQRSADVLSNFFLNGSQVAADELGRRHKFAASADDLLSRTRWAPEQQQSALEATYAYETVTSSARTRLFSIKRKQPPFAPASSHFGGTTDASSQDTPFRHMVNTNTLPPMLPTQRPSLGHKSSISGSIQGMLNSFSTSSFSRRKRNLSVNGTSRSIDSDVRPVSPLPVSSIPQYEPEFQKRQASSRQQNGRQSPFKTWKYPPGTQDPGRADPSGGNNGAVGAIHVNQTQLVARSSPPAPRQAESLPEVRPSRTAGRHLATSYALSNTDTIEEADGENDAISIGSGAEEEQNEEDLRLKDLASQQVSPYQCLLQRS